MDQELGGLVFAPPGLQAVALTPIAVVAMWPVVVIDAVAPLVAALPAIDVEQLMPPKSTIPSYARTLIPVTE